jgi:hypothetical protein
MRPLLLAFVPLVLSCDPPCPSYWQAVCKACGDKSPGCEHAKVASARELEAPAECSQVSTSFAKQSEYGHKRYCETWVNEPRPLDTLKGPWICSGVEVDFKGPSTESHRSSDPQQMMVNGVATEIYNVRTARFQVRGKLDCQFDLGPHEMSVGEDALAIRCPDAIGALPANKLVLCLKARK